MTRHAWLGLVALALLATACGDDDDGAGDTSAADTFVDTASDTTTPDTQETSSLDTADDTARSDTAIADTAPSVHRINVSSTAITGRQGKVLVVSGPNGGSRLCVPIGSDPFVLPAMALTEMPGDGNPCGAATAEARFTDGDHVVQASVFAPGSQSPEASTSATAVVAGAAVTVELDGAALSSGATTGSPGRVFVATSGAVTGRQGKILLVSAPGGRLCAPIDSASWTLSATALTVAPTEGDPCSGETAEATFAGGDVVVTAGIYTPGETSPVATTQGSGTVDGDVTVTLDAGALSAH